MPTPKDNPARIRRIIEGARAAGIAVAAVEVLPDGTVKIFDQCALPPVEPDPDQGDAVKSCDAIFGTVPLN